MIAARLAVQISAAEQRRLLAEHPPELRAYGLILRGQDLCLPATAGRRTCTRGACSKRRRRSIPDYGAQLRRSVPDVQDAWRYRVGRHAGTVPRAGGRAGAALRSSSTSRCARLCRPRLRLPLQNAARRIACSLRAGHELNPNDADMLAETGACASSCGDPKRGARAAASARCASIRSIRTGTCGTLAKPISISATTRKSIRTLSRMRDKSARRYRLLAASYALLGHMAEAKQYARAGADRPTRTSRSSTGATFPRTEIPEPLERYLEGLRKAGLK